MNHHIALLWGALFLMAPGCSDSTGPADSVADLELHASSHRLLKGGTLTLVATPRDGSGTPVSTVAVKWTSKDQAIATVNEQGLVTGVAFGSTEVIASVGNLQRGVEVQVVRRPSSCAEPGSTATTVRDTTTWRTADGPFHVDGAVELFSQLTVEPGTLICGGPHGELKQVVTMGPLGVNGSLVARGAPGDTIVFTATNAAQPWRGISAHKIDLQYVRIENALVGVFTRYGSLTIADSHFTQIAGTAISESQAAQTLITRTTVEHAGTGLAFDYGKPDLLQVTVRNVAKTGIFAYRAELSLREVIVDSAGGVGIELATQVSWSRTSNVLVTRSGTGVTISQLVLSPILTGFTIVNNRGDGVVLGDFGTVAIHGSNFSGNGGVGIRGSQYGDFVVDATQNWWGDPAGPNGPAGDGVAGNVMFTPVLTQPAHAGAPASSAGGRSMRS